MAAAGVVVGDDVGEIEAKLGNVGSVAVATVPDEVGGMEPGGDDTEGATSDEGEVVYGCDKKTRSCIRDDQAYGDRS